jgi:hypothetical protein
LFFQTRLGFRDIKLSGYESFGIEGPLNLAGLAIPTSDNLSFFLVGFEKINQKSKIKNQNDNLKLKILSQKD